MMDDRQYDTLRSDHFRVREEIGELRSLLARMSERARYAETLLNYILICAVAFGFVAVLAVLAALARH